MQRTTERPPSQSLRENECDIIPMAHAEGLVFAPWDVPWGGKICSDAEEARRHETGERTAQSLILIGNAQRKMMQT
jgi:hypothetical protein